ncbi:2Fe-2S iron-sulfur cluster-binding protein [Ferrovibrio sp.]|uniref:2Fe-2S iron-sulfur cluster-binding protein n=1 Tax=Ferrovibrio sp. TaxID=1917215 RepID=UPI00311F0868
MAHSVIVRQLPEPVLVEDGDTILLAAQFSGHEYPASCASGNCGACKSLLIRGDVELLPYSEFALTDEERAAGLILACRAQPLGDCEVAWLEEGEIAAHPQRKLDCRVTANDAMTHDIRRIRLAIEAGGPFDFSAGQYAAVSFAGQPARDYSMASRPGSDSLEFHIRLVPGGKVSPFVLEGLKPGDRATVEGPRGISFLREHHTGPIIALAGGSGLAPVKAIVERALALGMQQPIHLYFGVRDERDLYLEDHFRALEKQHGNFTFTPVLSQPSGETARRTGFLADAVKADHADLDGARAYLCGPPVMVETCMTALTAAGLARECCHADAFYTEADKAALTRGAA